MTNSKYISIGGIIFDGTGCQQICLFRSVIIWIRMESWQGPVVYKIKIKITKWKTIISCILFKFKNLEIYFKTIYIKIKKKIAYPDNLNHDTITRFKITY